MRRPGSILVSFALVVVAGAGPAHAQEARVAPRRAPVSDRLHTNAVRTRPAGVDALTRALTSGRIDPATYALERARALFDLAGVRDRFGEVLAPGPRDATMVLRDLLLVYEDLTPSERRIADRILARPTDQGEDPLGDGYTADEEPPFCSTNGCIHYVASTADEPPLADDDLSGVPDWVETVSTEFEAVWDAEITTFGFRPPKSDVTSLNNGGDGKLDIYLANLGDDGLYGYCSTDDPNVEPGSGYQFFDVSAYCVIDNDFTFAEFGTPSGVDALRVTLAHEFFHAVQFAYDVAEDRWFMESTAMWIEDEVFDDIDNSADYLKVTSPLTKPHVPLDANNSAFGVYGAWIFHRFLSEYLGTIDAHDIETVRRAWERADGSAAGPDRYSVQAIAAAVKPAGETFRSIFARFGMVNDVPAAFYDEAAANTYPVPPLTDTAKVTKRNGGSRGSIRMKHLTNRYFALTPGRGVKVTAKLRVRVDLPPYKTGPGASIVTISKSGVVRYFRLRLNADGIGARTVPFGKGQIVTVDLVLTNASTRFSACWSDFPDWTYSCAGQPRDDGLTYRFVATLVQ